MLAVPSVGAMAKQSEDSSPLCLLCSSTIPPRQRKSVPLLRTVCCSQPICESCLKRNPRLAQYNPCLKCLSGVAAVSGRRSGAPDPTAELSRPGDIFRSLGERDGDIFILGDEGSEESDSGVDDELQEVLERNVNSPTQASLIEGTCNEDPALDPTNRGSQQSEIATSEGKVLPTNGPYLHYYIQPSDSIAGIALKLRVDGRQLCKLNNLPPSTLTTSPHLLHTRTVLKLPPSSKPPPPAPPHDELKRRELERAEKRLQLITKETDWRVAKAYVSLADLDSGTSFPDKDLEKWSTTKTSVQERAVDAYLDDAVWERDMKRAGQTSSGIPSFPHFSTRSSVFTKPQ